MNPARGLMKMRCTIERNAQTALDPHGHKTPVNWQPLASGVPCWVSAGQGGRLSSSGGALMVSIDSPRSTFPVGTDVAVGDRLTTIADRLGNKKFPVLYVDAVMQRATHLEALLREIE